MKSVQEIVASIQRLQKLASIQRLQLASIQRLQKLSPEKKSLKIVEGVESVWYYHLSQTGKPAKPALCGNARVMQTEMSLDSWGSRSSHINEKYCPKCEKLAKEMGML